MKKLLFLLTLASFHLISQAQKLEISVQANSGLFHYTGPGAADNSFILENADPSSNYTNQPYGKHLAFSYGAGLKINFAGNDGFIFGAQTDYEILRSNVHITNVVSTFVAIPFVQPLVLLAPPETSGQTYLNSYAINISPYVGYRFKFKKVSLDVLPGIDVGVNLSSREKGTAIVTYPGITTKTTTNYDRGTPPNDLRLRLGFALKHNKFVINGSYANGYTNYMSESVGSNNAKVYGQLFRLGLGYQLY